MQLTENISHPELTSDSDEMEEPRRLQVTLFCNDNVDEDDNDNDDHNVDENEDDNAYIVGNKWEEWDEDDEKWDDWDDDDDD
ncbi:MAG: hypothetical protein K6C10_07910 [Prevotella sp.]|nr:hypothetical protein [Prevotella sp.]